MRPAVLTICTWSIVLMSRKEHGLQNEVAVGTIDGSLVPRPHPRGGWWVWLRETTLEEGKGSGKLEPNPWSYAEEFPRANQISVLVVT